MSGSAQLGQLVHSFFVDHLVAVKGLRPASVRSYRDTVRLLLCFVAVGVQVFPQLSDVTFKLSTSPVFK